MLDDGPLIESVEPGDDLPICIGGERACLPEDCGGVWGYEDLLKILQDPGHEERDFMRGWAAKILTLRCSMSMK